MISEKCYCTLRVLLIYIFCNALFQNKHLIAVTWFCRKILIETAALIKRVILSNLLRLEDYFVFNARIYSPTFRKNKRKLGL
jgi:hypothetical protein